MSTFLQDLRYALRQLRKSPGFTITAVLTLAIGIGANTGIFSVMDAVVLRPLAVPDLDRVVTVYEQKDRGGDGQAAALANFEDWQRDSRSFEEMAPRTSADLSLTGAGDAAHVLAEFTTPSFFSVMRTSAMMGRVFGQSETQRGKNSVAVVTYGFWKSHFGSDAGIVGREVELDQHSYTIVGVLPKTMQYPSTVDVFLPFAPTDAQLANRGDHDYLVVGRLRPGVTIKDAQAELNVIADRLTRQYPATNLGWSVRVESLLAGINGDLTPLYFNLIQAATLFVLLVVCANVANLQFSRGIARRPEIAMRTALGASRARLTRQLLTESLLLGLIGAAIGLVYAQVYLHLTVISMPEKVARYMSGWSNISLNARSIAISVVLAICAGILAGLSPALDALRLNLVDQLKSGSRSVAGSSRSRRLTSIFAVAQISLAVALVVGAALMAKGMTALMHSADRYNPGQTLTFRVHLPPARYDTPLKQAAWYTESLSKLQALPGVKHAELTTSLPESDDGWLNDCQIENRPTAPGKFQSALRLPVSAGYFDALHIPILSGRGFAQGDSLGAQPVAIVSREFVADYFPGENPIGRHIRMGATPAEQTPWLTIVGVADEADYFMFRKGRPAVVYMNAAQLPSTDATYAIVTDGDPMALAPAVRKTLDTIDPALPLDSVETYAKYLREDKLTGIVYVAVLLSVNALIALLLSAIGIYGVMANLVGERTREIGVRLAMGARREDVLRMILRRAAILTGTGLGVGLLMAAALAQGVSNLFFGVSPNDPAVFGSITAAIALIALASSWIPARRAATIDPIVALRDE
jgi:putative ABC transport system permease protein